MKRRQREGGRQMRWCLAFQTRICRYSSCLRPEIPILLRRTPLVLVQRARVVTTVTTRVTHTCELSRRGVLRASFAIARPPAASGSTVRVQTRLTTVYFVSYCFLAVSVSAGRSCSRTLQTTRPYAQQNWAPSPSSRASSKSAVSRWHQPPRDCCVPWGPAR